MGADTAIKVVIEGSRFGVDGSLKKFKRLCESAGVVREYRKRKEYKKPSVRRKEKKEAAEKRKAKAQAKVRRSSKI